MSPAEQRRMEEALDWVRRIHDAGFDAWEAHAEWLEASPDNLVAFDTASLLIEQAAEGLAPPPAPQPAPAPINDNDDIARPGRIRPQRSRWYVGLGAVAAAAVVGIITLPSLMQQGPQPYLVQTGPGEHRDIALEDGTRITLNGDSVLRLRKGDNRIATLERGEAYFAVRHDAAHPFAVHAGDAVFQDVGTAFDIGHDGTTTDIAVREGAVLYDPGGAAVRLDGGQAMHIEKGTATVRPVESHAVGTWRTGQLLYRDAPLAAVAADLARNIGQPVSVDPRLAGRSFSGAIVIDADRDRMFRRMAAVAGVGILHDGTGWRMIPPGR